MQVLFACGPSSFRVGEGAGGGPTLWPWATGLRTVLSASTYTGCHFKYSHNYFNKKFIFFKGDTFPFFFLFIIPYFPLPLFLFLGPNLTPPIKFLPIISRPPLSYSPLRILSYYPSHFFLFLNPDLSPPIKFLLVTFQLIQYYPPPIPSYYTPHLSVSWTHLIPTNTNSLYFYYPILPSPPLYLSWPRLNPTNKTSSYYLPTPSLLLPPTDPLLLLLS